MNDDRDWRTVAEALQEALDDYRPSVKRLKAALAIAERHIKEGGAK